jgi:hypothetical protein
VSNKERKKIQIGINPELHKTLMSIPHVMRGQFICMALHEYIKTTEGTYLLEQFAKYKPDKQKLEEEMKSTSTSSAITSLKDITGEF